MINILEAIAREMQKVIFTANEDVPEEKEVKKEAIRIESALLALSAKAEKIPELHKRLLVRIHGEDKDKDEETISG